MTFEQIWMLSIIVPPVLWMLVNSHRKDRPNRFGIHIFGTVLLLAVCLPGLANRESNAAAAVLVRAFAGLSDTDLKQARGYL